MTKRKWILSFFLMILVALILSGCSIPNVESQQTSTTDVTSAPDVTSTPDVTSAPEVVVCMHEYKPSAYEKLSKEQHQVVMVCAKCDDAQKVSLDHVPGAEATCTEAQKCILCEEILNDVKEHQPGEEATCAKEQNCLVCGAVLAQKNEHNYRFYAAKDKGDRYHEIVYKCTVCGSTTSEKTAHNYEDETCIGCKKAFVAREVLKAGKTKYAITKPLDGYGDGKLFIIFGGSGEIETATNFYKYQQSNSTIIVVQCSSATMDACKRAVSDMLPIFLSYVGEYDINIIGFSLGGYGAMELTRELYQIPSTRTNAVHILDGVWDRYEYEEYIDYARHGWNVYVYGAGNGKITSASGITNRSNKLGHWFMEIKAEGAYDQEVLNRLHYDFYNVQHGQMDDVVLEALGIPF